MKLTGPSNMHPIVIDNIILQTKKKMVRHPPLEDEPESDFCSTIMTTGSIEAVSADSCVDYRQIGTYAVILRM